MIRTGGSPRTRISSGAFLLVLCLDVRSEARTVIVEPFGGPEKAKPEEAEILPTTGFNIMHAPPTVIHTGSGLNVVNVCTNLKFTPQ